MEIIIDLPIGFPINNIISLKLEMIMKLPRFFFEAITLEMDYPIFSLLLPKNSLSNPTPTHRVPRCSSHGCYL